MKNNLTLFAREGKAKSLQNTGGGASQCQTSRSEGAQQSTAQHDSARFLKYFNTQMARFLWSKKGEATVSKSSCSGAQGRATSAEQPTNHALITHLSPTQTVSLARIWKYVACMLMVLFMGIGQMWGTNQTYTVTNPETDVYISGPITIQGEYASSKKVDNSNQKTYVTNNGPLYVQSKAKNIKSVTLTLAYTGNGSGTYKAITVKTMGGADFSVPASGVSAKLDDTSVSLSDIQVNNNNTSHQTLVVTCSTAQSAVSIAKGSQGSIVIKSVSVVYDDAITAPDLYSEGHFTSTTEGTATNSCSWGSFTLNGATKEVSDKVYYKRGNGDAITYNLASGEKFAEGDVILVDFTGSGASKTTAITLTNGPAWSQKTATQTEHNFIYVIPSGSALINASSLAFSIQNNDTYVYGVKVYHTETSGGSCTTPTIAWATGSTANISVLNELEATNLGINVTEYTGNITWALSGDDIVALSNQSKTGCTVTGKADVYGTATLTASFTLSGDATLCDGTYSVTKTITIKECVAEPAALTNEIARFQVPCDVDNTQVLTSPINRTECTCTFAGVGGSGNWYQNPTSKLWYGKMNGDGTSKYITITLTSGSFQAGDVVTIAINRDNTTKSGFKIKSTSGNTVEPASTASGVEATGTYTLTADDINNDGSLTFYRSNSSTYVNRIIITRPVSCAATVPGDISKGDLTAGEITLTAAGSAEKGDTWYWQSASDGTSTSDEYDAENGKTVDEAGTYYLRSYNTAGTCWSTAKSITLTAEDFVAHYAITYNKGAYGSGDAIAAGDKTEDEDFTLSSSMFTREGYVQVGWATSDGGSKAYDLGGTYSDNAALILYPVWAPKDTYVAAFEYDSESPAAPARWEFSTGDHTSTSNSADYVPTFGSEYPGDGPSDVNYIAFAKGGSAYAIYDLGYSTTVSQITATLYGGSSSDVSIDIQYLGADKSTVKNTYTAKAKNWGSSHTDAVSNDVVANVRYIKVKGASKWVVLSAFSVTYGDVTPKYTVTYVPNNGVEPAETMTDSDSPYKAGTEVTLLTNTFTAPATKEFDAWVVTPAAGVDPITITNGKFTMPSANVNVTATWRVIATKYSVTYVLNGPTGDAPTEADQAEGDEFTLASEPSWSGHVFQGWQWTDDESVTHLEDAETEFTMPAYAVTFTAQWKLDPQATMSDAQYVIGGSALNMAAKFSSLNTSGAVIFSLKESYEDASITAAGSFTATVAGEYIVVAEQAGNATYAKGEAEATVEVLESELSDIYIWKKDAGYTGCVANPNADAPAALYTDITYEGFTGMGRAAEDNTECILTFSIKNTYKSLFGIKDICTYGKLEEPLGGQISWDGGTNWEDLAKYSEGKKVFEAPGTFPTSFKIKFFGVSKSSGGLYWRNALVTLERKKEIVSTDIDLTDVKINGTSISAEDLATLKTADAYALDLEGEYVTAPTVKFNKHTVITYDDDSEVEKDDVISKTATVNSSSKWEASAEINDITYTVTMAKADAFIVHYYQADGKTLIGSENVAVSGHPTAAGITPTPIDYKRVVWKLSGEPVDLDDVTSDVAGTEITLVASYVDAYASSINIEQWVLDNKVANKAGFIAELEGKGYKQVDLNELDSLNDDPEKTNRNYAFLGMKVKKETSAISLLLKAGSTVKARFGNMGSSVNVIIGEAEPVALTSGSYANSSVSSAKEYSYTAEADVIVTFQSTGTSTVVFKQIMIDEAIETVTLPWLVTYNANGGSFGKTSEKYTDTPLVIADATPADAEHIFEGWHVGTVEGAKIDASAYVPTANVTLVAKYVVKPSPFSLSALTYKIGTGDATAVGYEEGTYTYTVELPYAGSYDAITVAYTLADGTSSIKSGAVLSVTSLPGAATFTVVAANEAEKTYTVNFKKAAKDGLEIIGVVTTGGTNKTVSGLYKGDAAVNLNSKKIDSDCYIYVTLKEGQTLQDGDVLVVDVNAKSDIGTKALEICTGTGNLDNGILTSVAVDDYSTGENSIVLASVPAGATSIGLKRSANLNAKINGLKVYRPMNPVLKSITFDETKIDVAGTTVEETLPYATDLSDVTAEYYWNGAGTAVVTTNEGDWAWGDNTYVLTDKDGDATTYTITLVRATRSSDKSLSSLTVDGNAVELKEGVYDYIYEYPYGTDPATVPVVAAEANDAHASVGTITQAASTAGTASFTVTAEDETEQEYTVSFKISRVPGLVIYDGSTGATAFTATSYEDEDTHFAWSIGSNISVSADNAPANSTWGGKTYTKILKNFKPKNGNNEVSFTVPSGYLAKIRLVGSTNSDGNERKMFIAEEATSDASKAIGNYVITSSTYEAQGLVTELLMPGTYYLGSTDTYRLFEFSAQLYPIDYTRDVTEGQMTTVCVDHNVPAGCIVGAEVYKLLYWKYGTSYADCQMVDFEKVDEMNAGEPYMVLPTSNTFALVYGAITEASPKHMSNGFIGTYDPIAREYDNILVGKYAIVGTTVLKLGHNCSCSANRAYINLSETPSKEEYEASLTPSHSSAPKKRVSLGRKSEHVATGMDGINVENEQVQKVMIDGQMYIVRGGHIYNATGILVK